MAQINIRVDDELKIQGEKLFSELGLNLSSAINVFLTQAVREQAIPFKISINNVPNEITRNAIKESTEIIKEGKSRFNNAQEMFDDLGI